MSDWGVDVSGLGDAQRRTAALGAFLLDLRPFWPKVVPLFVGWMREQFQTEGAFFGDPWAPLSPEYAARKAITHPGKSILIADGDLRRGASLPERTATPRTLTLTIHWPKTSSKTDKRAMDRPPDPAWHQEGTDSMPARPLVSSVLPPTALSDLDRVAEEYAEDLIHRLGLSR